MLIMDIPNVPPQDAPVLMQTAAVAQRTDDALYGTMGVCMVSPTRAKMGLGSGSSGTDGKGLHPQDSALRRFPDSDTNVELQLAVDNAAVQILQQPKHGVIQTVPGSFDFYYVPQEGYVGNDNVVFLVNIAGRNVKTVYYIKVVDSELNSKTFDALYAKYCPPPADWIISSGTNVPGIPPSIDAAELSSWLSLAQLEGKIADISAINVAVVDLPSVAVGQTIGTNITLDTNAAGHNWYIDSTPADNSEYLPTSNPYEWVAKAGTAAYGKMDMLSAEEYAEEYGVRSSNIANTLLYFFHHVPPHPNRIS